MKQKAASYLSTIKPDIININDFLHNTLEESYHEYASSQYLSKVLKNNFFQVIENFCDIKTAFKAEIGCSYPKIALLCEYDSFPLKGQILGTNFTSSVSVATALALSKVIDTLGGTVVVIGCPGELKGGSKVSMSKIGVFDDIDTILMVQPHNHTSINGSSPAILPISICLSSDDNNLYTLLDSCIYIIDSINILLKSYCKNCSIDNISIDGPLNPSIPKNTLEFKFSIKSSSLDIAYNIKDKIEEICSFSKNLLNIDYKLHLNNIPYDTLIPNNTLNRLLAHNLKECGIIHLEEIKNYTFGLSLGNVSHIVPCVRPFISISNNKIFGTKDFSDASASDECIDLIINCAQALTNTAIDLIEKESLIREAKIELNNLKS
jgi:metal-dependent amidase/aminoacylase/carboxypeptidase family protein